MRGVLIDRLVDGRHHAHLHHLALITSLPFTAICCASSAMVMDSGICTLARLTGAVGALEAVLGGLR